MAALERRPKPTALPELLRAARIERGLRAEATERLSALEATGRLVRTKGDRYTLPARLDLVAGRLAVHRDGFAFCVPDEQEEADVYVPAGGVRPAMHGDRVLVRIEPFQRRGRLEGRVVKVLERGTHRIVGVLRQGRTAAVLVPQEQRLTLPILVPRGAEGGARDGDMVVAELVRYPGLASEAEARVALVLGPADDPRVETEAVIHAHGLPLEFPPEVAAAARRMPAGPSAEQVARRLDLRALPIVTIDGENARDFDDAVLVEPLGRGFRLTVAVADVAHYVPAGSPLDLEARARGTSVYFPDRVVPMLPEELSNGICSLKPAEDRLVKAVRLELDARGRLVAASFGDAVIRSAARLTYTQVRQALVDGDPSVRAALGGLLEPLERAEALARLLIARRRARGSIDFDLPEAEVVLDLRGRPADIVRAERSIAHQMIEEFMLAANEAVARELARRGLPFPHRVHEPPAADSVAALARFLEGFGLRLRLEEGRPTPAAFQAVLEQVQGRPEERLVNTVLLRSMQQARYAAEPFGHFGLATDCYTHFTSPIRRYPDLVVHRLLDVALGGSGRVPPDLVAIAEESSRRERVAMEAEREIVQLKKIQFMQDKVGQVYEGFVSGVAPFGFFVELRDVFVEGLVHVTALGGDFYEHVEGQHLLRGRRTRRTYRVGDPVTVRVAGVSVERRTIDFVLANGEVEEPWRRRRRSR
ncbi:MAG: ribonuclease R [Deltaproteobacteria bacterium]|nr:MAG: ribonuclease R [Deltaproteobacteria bacterium]